MERWTAMTVGKKWCAAALLGAGAVLGLSACGSDEDAQARTAMIEGKPVEQAIAELGGSCANTERAGRLTCDYQGSTFVLAPNSWEAKAGQRERECRAEQVSAAVQVLTNHRWVITADDESSLESLKQGLSSKGAPSEIVGYCDWDEK